MGFARWRRIELVIALFIVTVMVAVAQPRGSNAEPASSATSEGAKTSADEQLVRQVVATLDYDAELSYQEAQQILLFSHASRSTKLETLRLALADVESAERAGRHAAFLAKAAVGLDPSGETTRAIIDGCLQPVLAKADSQAESVAAACMLLRHLPIKDARAAADMVTERMMIEDERSALVGLSETLSLLAYDLELDDAKRLSAALVQRMTTAENDYELWDLGEPLKGLLTKLTPADVQPLATMILDRMKTEQDGDCRIRLGSTLAVLATKLDLKDARALTQPLLEWLRSDPDSFVSSGLDTLKQVALKLEPEEVQPIAAAFVERLKIEREPFEMNSFAWALTSLAPKVKPSDARSLVGPLVERVKMDEDRSVRSVIGSLLGAFAPMLDSEDVRAVSSLLAQQIKTETSYDRSESVDALISLSSMLTPPEAQPLAAEIVELMTVTHEGAYDLHRALEAMAQRLEPADARPLARALVNGMSTREYSADLGEALGLLAPMLQSSDLQPAATILAKSIVDKRSIDDERSIYAADRIRSSRIALSSFAARLAKTDARSIALKLLERMKSEQDELVLAELGKTVGVLSKSLEANDLPAATAAIVDRIKIEQQDDALDSLTEALSLLAPNVGPNESRSIAASIVERMQNERDGNQVATLGRALSALADNVDNVDLRPGVIALVEAMKTEQEGIVLLDLGIRAHVLRYALTEEEFAESAETLLARLAMAKFHEFAGYGEALDFLDDELSIPDVEPNGVGNEQKVANPDLQGVLRAASVQSLVDALRAPLLIDSFVIGNILGALGEKLGETFDDDLTFVEWATTNPSAVALGLDLEGPGPWSAFEEPERTDFPPLRNVNIRQLGSIETAGAAGRLWVQEGLAYLPCGVSGLQIIDVADPSSPKKLGVAPAGPYAIAACVAGKYAYVVADPAGMPDAQLRVVDVSEANEPEIVGSFHLPDYPSGVAVQGHYVFVADRTEGLRVIDVSNPRAPKEVGALDTPGVVVAVVVMGDYALLADEEAGLRVVDISAVESPKEVALVRTEGPCIDLCVQSGMAYVATGANGLVVIDVSDPRSPQHVATIPTEIAVSVVVHENLAAVGAARLGIKVFDVTDPAAPAAHDLKMSANGVGVFFRGDNLFVTDVSFAGGPYGIGDQTTLHVYEVRR